MNTRHIVITAYSLLALIAASLAIAGAHAAPTDMESTPAVCAGVELRLVPGAVRVQPSPRMPRDQVVLALPLYPRAVKTSNTGRAGLFNFGYTTDIKTAQTTFMAPRSQAAVAAWYRAAFTRCGFTSDTYYGSGRGANGKPYQLASFQSPSLKDASAVLTYQSSGKRSTMVDYSVFAVTVPSRPPASVVQSQRVRSLRLTYQPRVNPRSAIRLVVTNRDSINVVAEALNLLPIMPAGEVFAGGYSGPSAYLRFMLSHGRSLAFRVDAVEAVTRGAALQDQSGQVDDAVGLVVYKWLYSHRVSEPPA
jgi:hypothetical protein